MGPACFSVHEHAIPASHIREYPRATAEDQEVVLQLAVKQYVPLKSARSGAQIVTIVGAHANGFPKELYEPLWDELFQRLDAKGVHISSIWIADVAHQGESSVLNEEQLGDDPSWLDHPRDLFLMINHFRAQMKRPLIGIGHSMGGNNLVNLALWHPRLFTTLILVDPVIQRMPSMGGNFSIAQASAKRRDRWPNREAARAGFLKSKFYQTWDPRVLDNWVEYGLRELPTYIYPDSAGTSGKSQEVTLKTTKHQEVLSFARANFATSEYPNPSISPNPVTHYDVNPETHPSAPFYRPEPLATFRRLPFLRPSVLYLFGDQSALSAPLLKADKVANTGTAPGGSGGAKLGRVTEVTFKGIGHLIPMEAVDQSADACASWIVPELKRWSELDVQIKQQQGRTPRELRGQMSKEFVDTMMSDWTTAPVETPAPKPSKL